MRESLKWIVIYIWYHLGLNSVLHFGQTYVFDTIITYKTINKTNTGMAIKYQGTSKWLPNQFTWQDESIRVEISKNKEINTFFIIAPPFWFYYSTLWGGLQEKKEAFAPRIWSRSLAASTKHSLRSREAKRDVTSPWAEGSLHRAKPCFIFHARQRASFPKQRALLAKCSLFWRRHPDLNWGIEVLQTSALPLGYSAV